MSTQSVNTLSLPKKNLIRKNADFIVDKLPDPSTEWQWNEITEERNETHHILRRLSETNLIDDVGVTWTQYDSGSKPIQWWVVEERAYELAKQTVENRDAILPCGHSGISNNGDTYSCCYHDCDRAFDRVDGDFVEVRR